MRRRPDWAELLHRYIRENSHRKYKYGKFDCVMFGAEWIKLITDVNILKGIRYGGYKSAKTLLKKHGGLFKLTASQMAKAGFKDVLPALAKRGDIVGFMTAKHGETVGICVGAQVVSPGDKDLVFVPMADAVRAWEVI